MKKGLCKNVILALCVLALVLQPVDIFADDIGTFNNPSVFSSGSRFRVGTTSFYFYFYEDLNNVNYVSDIISHFNITSDILLGASDNSSFATVVIPSSDYIYPYFNIPTGSFGTGNYGFKNSSEQTLTPLTSYTYNVNNGYSSSSPSTASLQGSKNHFIYIKADKFIVNNTWYTFYSGSGDSGNTDVSLIEDYIYYIWQDFILNNFLSWRTELNSWENIEWPSVGESLQYLMECAQNLNSSSVTIFRPQEMEIDPNSNGYVTRTNFLYGLTGNIQGILNKLNMAFPNDQAIMNDAIADQILDDTNDTGLTVNRITSAKSDLDDGLSIFKLDTSSSQYSNPFSALSDADWSFWSQTTLNNLGSGYNYSFGAGSLMSEDDIFTENQNTLLDLLGW